MEGRNENDIPWGQLNEDLQIHTANEWIDSNGKSWRRNGRTKTWVTRPGEFRIPVKFGLYRYDCITHLNAHEFSLPGSGL